jgi:hypothetical protein
MGWSPSDIFCLFFPSVGRHWNRDESVQINFTHFKKKNTVMESIFSFALVYATTRKILYSTSRCLYKSLQLRSVTRSHSCTLKMEAVRSSETSVLIRATRCHLPEDDNHHTHRRGNLKSYKFWFVTVIHKYLNRDTFWNDLLPIFMSWFCPAFWWRDSNIY